MGIEDTIAFKDIMTILLFISSMIQLYIIIHNTSKKDTTDREEYEKAREKESLELRLSINQINDNLKDLKRNFSNIDDLVNKDHERLIILEQDYKTLSNKIDELTETKTM